MTHRLLRSGKASVRPSHHRPIRRRWWMVLAALATTTTASMVRYTLAFRMPLGPAVRRSFLNHRAYEPLLVLRSYETSRNGRNRRNGSRYSRRETSREREYDSQEEPRRRRRSEDFGSHRESYQRYDSDYYGGGRRNSSGSSSSSSSNNNNYSHNRGRQRYAPDGRKKQPPRRGRGGGSRRSSDPRETQARREKPPPLPPLDSNPTYFTCRHTYEKDLRDELTRSLSQANLDATAVRWSRPHPGLVVALAEPPRIAEHLAKARPMYALQALPECVLVRAESIKGLAKEVMEQLLSVGSSGSNSSSNGNGEDAASGLPSGLLRSELVTAPKGSLSIHALVPEMGRGMPEAQLPQHRRATRIGEELATQLKKRCRAARVAAADDEPHSEERWLLQILLLEPEVVAASFARCQDSKTLPSWSWPNRKLPAGLANVDDLKHIGSGTIIDPRARIPSSAYRKLLEAFWYVGERPPMDAKRPVIDLGACPGGWTAALRLMGCTVLAVDRSPLDTNLMDDPGVEFVKGDAFRFVPPWARHESVKLLEPLPDTWMVSDIIAYPDKICELLDAWCGQNWVSHAIVTIKFRSEIPWEDVDRATALVKGHGYACRTVHFFNNKHEVTLLAVKEGFGGGRHGGGGGGFLGKPMYAPVLPKARPS